MIARAEAQRVAPIPEDRISRTWVREFADALAYSLFIAPVAAGIALVTLWRLTDGRIDLASLVVQGIPAVTQSAPVPVVAAVLTYAFSAFAIAEVVGAIRAAGWIRSRLVTLFKLGQGLSDEPLWWTVFEEGAQTLQKKRLRKGVEVFLNVHMSGGGRYTGVMHHFTVAADTEPNRDFAIWKARYYAPDNTEPAVLPSEDIVILNARDCRAIEVRYVPKQDIVIVPKPAELKLTTHPPTVTVSPPSAPRQDKS